MGMAAHMLDTQKDSAFPFWNYRGVPLTTILSKVAEKFVGTESIHVLRKKVFGKDHWALALGLGPKDLIAISLMFLSSLSGQIGRLARS